MSRKTKSISPIHAARVLHADLCAQRRLVPVAPPADLPTAPGEWTLGVIPSNWAGSMHYYRYCPAEVVYTTGPAVIVGTPQFLAGYALGSLANHIRLRRKARHLAQPQWRSLPLACIAVTNHSLWCHVNQHWIYFDHAAITSHNLHHHTLTLTFTSTVPLQLTGPWAPWITVATAHLRYGTTTAAHIPPSTPSNQRRLVRD